MHYLRPIGMPIMDTNRELTAAAKVYADAISGITYVPVGFCKAFRICMRLREG